MMKYLKFVLDLILCLTELTKHGFGHDFLHIRVALKLIIELYNVISSVCINYSYLENENYINSIYTGSVHICRIFSCSLHLQQTSLEKQKQKKQKLLNHNKLFQNLLFY